MGSNNARQLIERARQEWEASGKQWSIPFEVYYDYIRDFTTSEGDLPIGEEAIKSISAEENEQAEAPFMYPHPWLLPEKVAKHLNDSPEDPSSKTLTQPPLNAEFFLHLLLRHDEHDAIIGDLIERYGKKCARLGTSRANFWFYAEVFWTALPLIKRALLKVSGMMALAEFVRRHIS